MIDLHNHIIDESEIDNLNWEKIMETACFAVGEGVEHIVWTPEIYSRKDLAQLDKYHHLTEVLQQNLNDNGYPVTASLGADLHLLRADRTIFKTLKQSLSVNYLIVSLASHMRPDHLDEIILNIVEQGLIPIIAHPEQYFWLKEEYCRIFHLIELGAWIQITSDSLLGMLGPQAEMLARRLLKDGLVHLVASETHSLDYKAPLMGEARHRVEKILTKKETDNIFHNRAAALINNQSLDEIPIPPGILAHWSEKEVSV